jgi:hypothetical protein
VFHRRFGARALNTRYCRLHTKAAISVAGFISTCRPLNGVSAPVSVSS